MHAIINIFEICVIIQTFFLSYNSKWCQHYE